MPDESRARPTPAGITASEKMYWGALSTPTKLWSNTVTVMLTKIIVKEESIMNLATDFSFTHTRNPVTAIRVTNAGPPYETRISAMKSGPMVEPAALTVKSRVGDVARKVKLMKVVRSIS